MKTRRGVITVAMAMASLACAVSLHAHHSLGMFDLSTPIWVKGTVVRFERINPHSLITLEEKQQNGTIQRWTLEGPSVQGLDRMVFTEDLPKVGDPIQMCAFAFTPEFATRRPSVDTDGVSLRFVHGHVLMTPDGQMRLWGSYGKLDNCVRPEDQTQSWLHFLNTDTRARGGWCNTQLAAMPSRAFSKAFVDEISRRMANPCE